MLRGYEERIKGGEISLGDLATSESDCSSARKKGDLYVVSLFSPLLFSLSETVVCSIGRADNLLIAILKGILWARGHAEGV